jgi:orotate phosphoribosyltransferase
MKDELLSLVAARKGHFKFESGHHGDLWLNLELLCLEPGRVRTLAAELARRLSRHDIQAICGPLVEGAFIALMVAEDLNLAFTYAERFAPGRSDDLYSVDYRLPGALRGKVRGKRVAIVNDVINAGSAVRGTFTDLVECGARPVVVGTLLVLGPAAASFAADRAMALESLAVLPNNLWLPSECPLCSAGVPLDEDPQSSRL